MIEKIKIKIKENTSPRHVPRVVRAVKSIPYTRSGKKMELAVFHLINGRQLNNTEVVSNPDSLQEYQKMAEEKKLSNRERS